MSTIGAFEVNMRPAFVHVIHGTNLTNRFRFARERRRRRRRRRRRISGASKIILHPAYTLLPPPSPVAPFPARKTDLMLGLFTRTPAGTLDVRGVCRQVLRRLSSPRVTSLSPRNEPRNNETQTAWRNARRATNRAQRGVEVSTGYNTPSRHVLSSSSCPVPPSPPLPPPLPRKPRFFSPLGLPPAI
jgi:hypothetical protein